MKDYNQMSKNLFERREQYIAERKKKRNALIKTASGLSCFCLTALTGLWILNSNPGRETIFPADIIPIDIDGSGISDLQSNTSLPDNTASPSGHAQSPSADTENLAGNKGESETSVPGKQDSQEISKYHSGKEADPKASGKNTEDAFPDVPVSEQSPGSLTHITAGDSSADFFGGSYTNNQGLLCILLTEDTPENRAAICKELNLNENNVVFQSAQYTLSYLTELQARISQGMISRELNFIVVSALMEDINRIRLTVTTQDASLLEKVNALDRLGGALEIEYQPEGGMIKEDLKKLIEPKNLPEAE